MRTCATCKHRKHNQCRFNAPESARPEVYSTDTQWPLISPDDTCGQHALDGQPNAAMLPSVLFAETVLTFGSLMARTDEVSGQIIQSTGIHRYMP